MERFADIAGRILGSIWLGVGVAIVVSDIPPSELCFKRCEIPSLLVVWFGEPVVRIGTGLIFAGVGAGFVFSGLRELKRA